MDICPFPSQLIQTSAGLVEYAETGSGFPVVIAHGGPGGYDQGMMLGAMIPASGFRLISPSRPGYLRTSIATGRAIGQQADVFAALLDALEIDKAAIIGASAGGPVGYEFAIRHPSRTVALVVIDGVCGHYHIPPQAGKVTQALFLSPPGIWLLNKLFQYFPAMIIKTLLTTEGALTVAELKTLIENIMHDPRRLHYVKVLLASMNHYALRKPGVDNDIKQLTHSERPDLKLILAPTLVIHGTADADVPFADGEYAAANIKKAQHLWIDRGTHFCFWLSESATAAQARTVEFLRAAFKNEGARQRP